MEPFSLQKAFTLIEPGPVLLMTTTSGMKRDVMTLTWHMVVDFSPRFAIATGPWNFSWRLLKAGRTCVLAVPPADWIRKVIAVGMISGAETDKFARFDLETEQGRYAPPLLTGCIGCIECRVLCFFEEGIVLLQGEQAWLNPQKADSPRIHAVGDGRFVTDGAAADYRSLMAEKLPEGV